MKFDMHCHTKEGSIDGKVSVTQVIAILKSKGFQGMLVSDHNSYKGYYAWKRQHKTVTATGTKSKDDRKEEKQKESKKDRNEAMNSLGETDKEFVVLQGIEYDTIDGGHILVIMPTGKRLKILELKGLPVQLLIEIVHRNGGILGPAHPCGEKYVSITNTHKYHYKWSVMEKFDFIEGFNACEKMENNRQAMKLANKFQKPAFGGSDAHKIDCIGLAYTEFDGDIRNESDLITFLKKQGAVSCGGNYYRGTTKEKLGKANKILVQSFWIYNRFGFLWNRHRQKREINKL